MELQFTICGNLLDGGSGLVSHEVYCLVFTGSLFVPMWDKIALYILLKLRRFLPNARSICEPKPKQSYFGKLTNEESLNF